MKDKPDDKIDEILDEFKENLLTIEEYQGNQYLHAQNEAIDEAKQQIEDFYRNKILEEKTELLDALYWMYVQYCGNGHYFMGAGETASELLENAGYIEVDVAGIVTKDNGDSQEQRR